MPVVLMDWLAVGAFTVVSAGYMRAGTPYRGGGGGGRRRRARLACTASRQEEKQKKK